MIGRFIRLVRNLVRSARPADQDTSPVAAEAPRHLDLQEYSMGGAAVPLRQVRVAVTMVGGVSLAIYENGVAQELYRMVRGYGMYGLLKRLTASHAYIDILSGTSAGGINTIHLSAALTMQRDFTMTRERWIDLGGVDALLQNPKDTDVQAIFRGNTYYFKELEDTFLRLSGEMIHDEWNRRCLPSGIVRCRPKAKEGYTDLDLLITGTYHQPRARVFFDRRNQPLFTHDHNGVFHLKHRASRNESHFVWTMREPRREPVEAAGDKSEEKGYDWRKYDDLIGQRIHRDQRVDPEEVKERRRWICERLGRIARTTSSLPAIFEPSAVNTRLMNGAIELPKTPSVSYMMDGGFLNNRPLNLVIPEIAKRPATHEVLRKVVFVEPVPEELRSPTKGEFVPPTALGNLSFFAQVPHRQSLTASLTSIAQHNQRARRVRETLCTARRSVSHTLRDAQQQILWAETCLLDLRAQLVRRWQEQLKLEGFEEETGPNPTTVEPQAEDEQARKQHLERLAQNELLRQLRDPLLKEMQEHCFELIVTRQRIGDGSNRPSSQYLLPKSGEFLLAEVDTNFLSRKIGRAIDEIRLVLFPRLETDRDRSEQQERQDLLQKLADPVLKEVKSLLVHLYYLHDLTEIIGENVAEVAKTVIGSSDFADTDEGTGKQTLRPVKDVSKLWSLLVGSLRELLTPQAPGWSLVTKEAPTVDWEEPGDEFIKSAQDLASNLGDRSKEICRALLGKKLDGSRDQVYSEGKREEYKRRSTQAPSDNSSIVCPIGREVNRLVRDAAEKLEHAVRAGWQEEQDLLAKQQQPLVWAYSFDPEQGDTILSADEIGRRLEILDAFLYPIERVADLPFIYPIELISINPRDVQVALSNRSLKDKIGGDAFGNSGGFFKRSWRSNDIMWGRLDASGALAHMLGDEERLERILSRGPKNRSEVALDMIGALDAYMLRGEVTAKSSAPLDGAERLVALALAGSDTADDEIGRHLRKEYAGARDTIFKWLNPDQRSPEGDTKTPQASIDDEKRDGEDPENLNPILKWLLRRHQLEVLCEELPETLAAALSEHAAWQGRAEARQLRDALLARRDRTTADEPGSLSDVEAKLSQEASRLASISGIGPDPEVQRVVRREASAWARELLSDPEKIERHFKEYRVGQEDLLTDIPPLVLLNRAVLSLLVGLHVLGNSIGSRLQTTGAGKVFNTWILRPLQLIVGAMHGFTRTLAQGSTAAAATHAVAWTVVVLGLLLAFFIPVSTARVLPFVAIAALGEVLYWWLWEGGLRTTSSALLVVSFALLAVLLRWGHQLEQLQPWLVGFGGAAASAAVLLEIAAAWSWKVALTTVVGIVVLLCGPIAERIPSGHPFHQMVQQLVQAPIQSGWLWSFGVLAALGLVWTLASLRDRNGIVALELAGNESTAREIVRGWDGDPQGRVRKVYLVAFDYLFLVLYSCLIGFGCVLVAEGMRQSSLPLASYVVMLGLLLAWGQWLAAAFDIGENTVLMAMILGGVKRPLPQVARACATPKFILILLGLLYVVVGSAVLLTMRFLKA